MAIAVSPRAVQLHQHERVDEDVEVVSWAEIGAKYKLQDILLGGGGQTTCEPRVRGRPLIGSPRGLGTKDVMKSYECGRVLGCSSSLSHVSRVANDLVHAHFCCGWCPPRCVTTGKPLKHASDHQVFQRAALTLALLVTKKPARPWPPVRTWHCEHMVSLGRGECLILSGEVGGGGGGFVRQFDYAVRAQYGQE